MISGCNESMQTMTIHFDKQNWSGKVRIVDETTQTAKLSCGYNLGCTKGKRPKIIILLSMAVHNPTCTYYTSHDIMIIKNTNNTMATNIVHVGKVVPQLL